MFIDAGCKNIGMLFRHHDAIGTVVMGGEAGIAGESICSNALVIDGNIAGSLGATVIDGLEFGGKCLDGLLDFEFEFFELREELGAYLQK